MVFARRIRLSMFKPVVVVLLIEFFPIKSKEGRKHSRGDSDADWNYSNFRIVGFHFKF